MKTTTGKIYWRSLDQLQDTAEFREFLHREFPVAASEFPEGLSRRRWMQLMGASLALGGLAGCRWEEEKIAPFAMRPENRIPGEAEFFATSIEIAGMPRHLLATCYDGRPVKIEGNPDHPASQGASDALSQATILDLYDPDRSDALRQTQGRQSFRRSWQEFEEFAEQHFGAMEAHGGEGLRVLVEPTSSLTVQALLPQLLQRFPKAVVHTHSTISWENQLAGTKLAFGNSLRTRYNLSDAKTIAAFDEDLLGLHPDALQHARGFAAGREPGAGMSRIYSAESQFSVTGAAADHRLPIKSSEIGRLIAHVEAKVRLELGEEAVSIDLPTLSAGAMKFAEALAVDLVANRGQAIVAVGPSQPSEVHALACGLNVLLENVDKTVRFLEDPTSIPKAESLGELVAAIERDQVDTLLILGGNPIYDAPGDLHFEEALAKIETSIHLSRREDETSRVCTWHLPEAHCFEAWNDVRSWDGTICVSQPLIAPLLDGRSAIEVLALLVKDQRDAQQLVREAVSQSLTSGLSSEAWAKLLHDGFQTGSELPTKQVASKLRSDRKSWCQAVVDARRSATEIVFVSSESVLDGRFANNGWLQETPGFLTKLTWDNAAILSPKTAEQLGVQHGSVVKLQTGSSAVELPAFLLPGQAEGSIGVALGYGRKAAGKVGGDQQTGVEPVGVDVNPLRTSESQHFTLDFEIKATDKTHEFATTQDHHMIDTVGLEETGRRVGDLVREGTLDEYQEHPDFAQHRTHHPPLESLWEEPKYEGHAWGMSIDLNKCIGCNACMVACQSENNVPIVGKDQVAKGREMHWIRVDRYFEGDIDNPSVATQPVACHHCENAPCEQVCPVAATVHSDEGLNDMVYNRCIGTRYCANNCPYKVRRFNFLDYNENLEEANRELAQLVVNPEVTVRSRGVMEKCTYCVQRIQGVKIDAKNDRRPIADGEVKTACQQACPTQAIEFGDLNDNQSRVALSHANSRAYGMLSELNVKPRTKYLARVRNPSPLLEPVTRALDQHHGSDHGHS
ncbi:MAG: TAT-variant-translocated molybdopterin oxidoreductase [Pseudomonadota bacterium]